jgi:hypothetical protein
MYMAILDEEGRIEDTLYEDDFRRLLANHGGKFVVGVSVLERGDTPTFFAGILSPNPETIHQALLERDLTIEADTFKDWLKRGNAQRSASVPSG